MDAKPDLAPNKLKTLCSDTVEIVSGGQRSVVNQTQDDALTKLICKWLMATEETKPVVFVPRYLQTRIDDVAREFPKTTVADAASSTKLQGAGRQIGGNLRKSANSLHTKID